MVYLLDSAFLSSQTTEYLWMEISCELLVFVSDELKLEEFVSEELKLEKWSSTSHGNCLYEVRIIITDNRMDET